MNLPLTTAAAQTESFEALNEGIWVTEAALTNIETALAARDERVAELEATLSVANESIAAHDTAVETLNQTITANEARIAELEAENAGLRRAPAASFQNTSKAEDEKPKAPAFHLSDENPMNKLADSLMGKPKS